MAEGKEIFPANKGNKAKAEPGNEIRIPDEIIEKAGGKENVRRIFSYFESFSGPLPHPKIFAQYKAVMPDAPKRIFRMAEKQQEHRFGLENSVYKVMFVALI